MAAGLAVAAAGPRAAAPDAVKRLAGCWQGEGAVRDKPVRVRLSARDAALGALFVVDVESAATGDPADRYAAHLIFAGAEAGRIVGYWADSYGGAYTATGEGRAGPDGFDMRYAYPDATFTNRWRLTGGMLAWTITARREGKPESVFAKYILRHAPCPRG